VECRQQKPEGFMAENQTEGVRRKKKEERDWKKKQEREEKTRKRKTTMKQTQTQNERSEWSVHDNMKAPNVQIRDLSGSKGVRSEDFCLASDTFGTEQEEDPLDCESCTEEDLSEVAEELTTCELLSLSVLIGA
jgi:hypothetical protein